MLRRGLGVVQGDQGRESTDTCRRRCKRGYL
jgi:hypothetical protein